jgi:osmotically-inducible protein OsmY
MLILLLALAGCSERQQKQADERAQQAKRDVQKAARELKNNAERLADSAKRESERLSTKAQSSAKDIRPDAEQAREKLDRAGQKTAQAGREALSDAERFALKGRIKTALVNDVGLKTVSNISVDLNESTATLSGTVPTAADKDRAEQTVMGVSGVSRVVNRLEVR